MNTTEKTLPKKLEEKKIREIANDFFCCYSRRRGWAQGVRH